MDGPPPPRQQAPPGNRLYLGNLPPTATKADIEQHFASGGGASRISEIKLMTGFGFVEYEDVNDAKDAVDHMNGTDMMGSRLNVQFARGGRERREPFYPDRPAPRTRRTLYRLNVTGLQGETSWQDLKDFARLDGLDVVYSEISRERDGRGFVEYETEDDLNNAAAKLDGVEFRGAIISASAAVQTEMPQSGGGGRFRSRSPGARRGGYGGGRGGYDDYDRRGPPRGYGGDRGGDRGYRDRSPPRRGYYEDDYRRGGGYGDRGPPPPRRGGGYGGPPDDNPYRGGGGGGGYGDDYPPPARRGYGGGGPPHDDPYGRSGGGGGRGSYDDRPMSPGGMPPRRSPPRDGYGGGGYGDRPPRRGGRY